MAKRRISIIAGIIVLLFVGMISLIIILISKEVILISKESLWSIGIYSGDSPYNFKPSDSVSNPILTPKDVKDVCADFVADPFMVREGSRWYMFFEVMNAKTSQGDIGLAASEDGMQWIYEQVVLDEPFHLSYPYIFKWNEEYYMIPESSKANSVRLYKAVDFPVKWNFAGSLLSGNYVDPCIFRYDNIWWLFVCLTTHDTLKLFYADELTGPWSEHPKSPIISGNANIARPGGRVLVRNDFIIRYAQDCKPTYGKLLRAFEIILLTKSDYEEREAKENPILKAEGFGWNRHGMHNIDPYEINENEWIACVDGYKKHLVIRIEY